MSEQLQFDFFGSNKISITLSKLMKPLNESKHIQLIDSAIKWITLSTLLIIPLIFNYFEFITVFAELKLVTLHLGAGLILILWVFELVFKQHISISYPKRKLSWYFRQHVGWNPARWALIGAGVWFIALVISTLLSPLPHISFFGAEDNRSGYNLYDNISLFIIFLSIAIRFRSITCLKLLAYTLIISGTLVGTYGIAQHFDWDPLGDNIGLSRVRASFGNPLDLGGYLVMTIPATLALGYLTRQRKFFWISLIVFPLGLQLAGLWFTGSRGPYIATLTALITFFVIAFAIGHFRSTIRPALILIAGAIFAAVIITLPSPRDDVGIQRILSIENQITGSEKVSNELSGGLSGRLNIWNSTLGLATKWYVPTEESSANTLLRPVFGLGPDMFIYSFSMIGEPRTGLEVVDHAHNYGLQILMEQGLLGLIGYLVVSSSLTISAFVIVKRLRSSDYQLSINAILILILAPPMIGKMIEIQSGVARVSHMAMMFAVFGSLIALYEVINRQETVIDKTSALVRKQPQGIYLLSRLLIVSLVATIIITIFVGWDMRRLSSSRTHAIGVSTTPQINRIQTWANAQSQAPERPSLTNALYIEYFRASIYHHDRGEEGEALRLMLLARKLLLDFEKHDPFKRDTQINLLQTEIALTQWGHLEYAQQAVDRSRKIITLFPSYPSFISMVATNMTLIGMHELAIEYADLAIDVENLTQPWSKAWYAKGRALYELGHIEEAIIALNTAVEKRPGAEGAIYAHKVLSQIYMERKKQGDEALYQFHNNQGQMKITVEE